MSLEDRLLAIGMSKAAFAEKVGVSRQAVSQWGDPLPEKAEGLLASLEASVTGEDQLELGWLVQVAPTGYRGLIVRRDRYESLYGKNPIVWLYWIVEGRLDKGGVYRPFGSATSELRKYLTVVDKEPNWSREKIDSRLTGEKD